MSLSGVEHKAVVRRAMVEPLEHGHTTVIDELYAPDFVGHDPANPHVTTPADTKAFVTDLRQAYADIVVTIDDQVAEGDRVVTRWTFRGTDTGAVSLSAAPGTTVAVTGITISRLRDGKIVEEWVEWDALGLQRHLGRSLTTE
jgi:steroid delta-isomerase-like uncharacterized protein